MKKRVNFTELLKRIGMLLRGVMGRLVVDSQEVHHSLVRLLGVLSEYSLLVDGGVREMFYQTFEMLDRAFSQSQQ